MSDEHDHGPPELRCNCGVAYPLRDDVPDQVTVICQATRQSLTIDDADDERERERDEKRERATR